MKKDILIIGGGPSGLSTALHLQQISPELAARTLVLEKAHHPRTKLCAGGLVADAEIVLQGLDLDVTEIPHVDSKVAHFDFSGKGLTIRVPGTHSLRIIRRDEFDYWLATKARERGIEILEGINVKSVRVGDEKVTVETDHSFLEGTLVIGADGSNGIVRRCVLPNTPVYTARVLEVLTPSYLNQQHAELEAYFDFFPVPRSIAGYTWDFPTQVKGQPTRCLGIYDANIYPESKRAGLKEILAEEMARLGYNLKDFELKGHPIHWFDPFIKVNTPRVILVGDAAGADPIFGEGISMALGYGKLAAREIEKACKNDDFTFKHYQRHLLFSPLGQTLITRWFIAYIVYTLQWKWLQFLIWRVLKPLVVLVAWIFVLNWARRMR